MLIGPPQKRENQSIFSGKLMTVRKTELYIIIALIAIVIFISCSLCFNSEHKDLSLSNTAGTSGIASVGEIYKGVDSVNKTKHFSGENLSKLYDYITGSDGSKLSDVNTLLSSTGELTAQDIRSNNDSKDVTVMFGGENWHITDVTKDSDGNTIATLWLASSSDTCKWNLWQSNTPTLDYPSSMYSSSYIRAYALNSGGSGYVASTGATTLTPVAQTSSHKFAKFTMPTANDALTDYIVTPAKVTYQSTQNQMAGSPIGSLGYTLPNEAWGTPSGVVNWYNATFNYSIKHGYSEWKDDYIWLPSLTETGYGMSDYGLWQLSDGQRSNSTYTWLRSGGSGVADGVYCLKDTGAFDGQYVALSFAVRPALHLNLTKADGAAVYELPAKQEVIYDGNIKSIESILKDKALMQAAMTLSASSQVSGTNADEYTAKITLSAPYKWATPNSGGGFTTSVGTVAKDYKWKINPKQLSLTWSGISSSYVWRSDLLTELQKYKPVIGGGVVADNLDVQLTYDGSANNTKLDTSGAHKIKADIVTNNTASGAAALLKQNYIMPLANSLEYTYTVKKAEQLAPILGIDYENEKLIPTNPTVNGQDRKPWLQYKDDSGNWQAIVDMKIPDAIMVGGAISFRYKVPASHTDYIEDSGEYSLIIPKRQTASDMAIDYEKESVNIGGGYSYYIGASAPTGMGNYNVAATDVSLDLGEGGLNKIVEQGQTENKIYYYVSAIVGTAFRSDIEELLIPARRAAPALSINYKTEKTGQPVTSKVTYTITGYDAPVRGNGNLVDLSPDRTSKTMRAWYAADDNNFKSKDATLTIPARPAAPVIEYDIDSEEYLNKHAPTDKMEYRASTSTLWDKADENTKPKRGTYVFRYIAVEEDKDNGITGAFASIESAVVDYGNKTINVTVRWKDERGGDFLSAYDYSGEVIKPTAVFYTVGGNSEQVPVPSGIIRYVITNSLDMAELNPKDADTYKVVVSITDAAYTVIGGEIEYTIDKLKIAVPRIVRDVVYNGKEQDIRTAGVLADYDGQYVDTTGAIARDVSLDGYTMYMELKSPNYEWADGRQENYVDIEWNIKPIERPVKWKRTTFTYDGSIKCPEGEIAGCDGEKVTLIYKGDTDAYKVHKGYTVTASISRGDPNYLNYTLTAGSESATFDIVLGVGMTLIFIEWTDSDGNAFTDGGSLKYSGDVQHPKAVVRKDSADGEIITDIEIEYVDADGNPITSKWTGSYSVRIKVDNTLYGIDGECLESISYNIIVDDNGDGEYKIVRIEIGGNYKSSYAIGEQFNATGMVVYGIYPDGEKAEINVNDYTYAPKEALTEGDNTITVSYGNLSASFTVRAGSISGPMGGDFDGGEYVKKKLYIITVAAIGGLLMICILMAGVIISGNSRERKYLREVIRRREESESKDVNKGDDEVED